MTSYLFLLIAFFRLFGLIIWQFFLISSAFFNSDQVTTVWVSIWGLIHLVYIVELDISSNAPLNKIDLKV